MFDGMPDQFYQFLAAATASRTTLAANTTATTATSLQLPLSFSLHHQNHHDSFPTYSPPPPSQPATAFDPPYHLLHHSQFLTRNNIEIKQETLNLHDHGIPRSLMLPEIPWSNDEMLALFRIRSSMDNTWFPDIIWENVSRKLAELGFKRSAEKCKEKFEEETRISFNNSSIISDTNNNCSNKNINATNNYRLFGELEELCNNNNANTNHPSLPPSPPPPPPPPPPPRPPPDHRQSDDALSERDECLDADNENNEDVDVSQEVTDKKERDIFLEDDHDVDDVDNDDDDEGEDNNTKNDDDDDDNNNAKEEQSVDDDSEKTEENTKKKVIRKRKRQKKFEMFKGFCEQIVNKMMVQQEQLHCKILQDMVKRDEETIAKEEAWKKQETERLQKELEARAYEQTIVGDRQAKIFDCLNKFNSSPLSSSILDSNQQFLKDTLENLNKVPNLITLSNSSILAHESIISAQLQINDQNHNRLATAHQTCPNIKPTSSSSENVVLSPIRLDNSKISLPNMSSSSLDEASQNPNMVSSKNEFPPFPSSDSSHKLSRLDHTSTNVTDHSDRKSLVGKDDIGRRWPRDEVLALINIRCNHFNNNGGIIESPNDKESFSNKVPLWERISQKMTDLGYKRSAKRCKEKWENINKYFRKTKDLNKKRSIDSRTCPYFHQLSHLYNQGTVMGPTDKPETLSGSPESNRSMAFSGAQGDSSTHMNCGATNNSMHASQGNEGVVQVPGFDFEF